MPQVFKQRPQLSGSVWRSVQSGPHAVFGAVQFIAGPVSGPASGRVSNPLSWPTTLPSPPPPSPLSVLVLDEHPAMAASTPIVHSPSARFLC